MTPLWSWLRRLAPSRPAIAPPRSPRPLRTRVAFEPLEDRLSPSASPSVSSSPGWRNQTFRVDDVVLSTPALFSTVNASAINQSFGGQIGLDQVFANTPNRGAGYTVAVLDTGIDYNHPDLGGGWGRRVVGGWDFVNNDADPMDDNGHGTHVAGIIGSSNANLSGVAPNVNLIALKVLDASGQGSFGNVENALSWVIANRARFNIVSLNLSLGSGNYAVNPYDFLEDEFASLKASGVFLSVAAGNSYYSYSGQVGLAYPGVSPNVVSVGAVWTGDFGPMAWGSGARDNTTAVDRIASFSQRAAGLGIMAPGAMITSTYLGGQYRAMAGTSMASPVIAGSAAMIRQALDQAGKGGLANEDYILGIMRSTGVRVIDGDDENDNVPNTGWAFQRINLAAAMQAAGVPMPPPNAAPVIGAIGTQTLAPGASTVVNIPASDPNNDPITYSVRVFGLPADPGLAYRLKTSLGLWAMGSYYQNTFGMNEKWLAGGPGLYYVVLPNGEFRQFAGTAAGTMAAANLLGTLETKYYDDPALILSAQPGAVNPIAVSLAGNQITITSTAAATGSYQVEVTASDGKLTSATTFTVTFTGPVTPPPPVNRAPVWTTIPDRTVTRQQRSLVVPLTASDPEGKTLTYTAKASGATGVAISVSGSQLTLSLPAGLSGSFTVDLTASDGALSATTSFRVTITNSAPTLSVPATVTAAVGATSVVIPVNAADPDGDPVAIAAKVTSTGEGSSLAYQLKTTYNLAFAGSYFTNAYGLGEKWLKSADGLSFYCLLPNGELHKFNGSVADMTKPSTLLATLDSSFHADPSKLWNATPPSSPKATATVSNGQVIVTLAGPARGSVSVEITVSDGLQTVTRTVVVTFP